MSNSNTEKCGVGWALRSKKNEGESIRQRSIAVLGILFLYALALFLVFGPFAQ